MKKQHPNDYNRYFSFIEDIISNPDYVAKHPEKDSIEFIKLYSPDHVLVAVRVSSSGNMYARTLFVMNPNKVEKYIRKNYMIPIA